MQARNQQRPEKKQIPSLADMSAIQEFSHIYYGDSIQTQQETSPSTMPKWLEDVRSELIRARRNEGQEGFWKVYDAAAEDRPKLKEWRHLIQIQAPPDELEADARITTGKNGTKVFRTLSMSEVKKMPRAKWQIPGIYQAVSVSLTYGDANTGKTFVDLDIALHLAYGLSWQGRKVEQTRVLYIYGEGNEGLANRIEAWQQWHDLPDTDYIQFICFPVQIISELDILCATLEEQGTVPGLVTIDTFSVCAEGVPENDNVEIAKFIACASHIKRTYKTHVHIIHHAGKNGDYRGAAAFRGNVDTMTLLSREAPDAPVIMTCKKQKDAPYYTDIRLQLETVNLGFDQESLETITSCVVTACTSPSMSEEKANKEQVVMLESLTDSGRLSTDVWKQACLAKGISRNAFYDRKKELVQTGRVREEAMGIGKPTYYSVVKDPS